MYRINVHGPCGPLTQGVASCCRVGIAGKGGTCPVPCLVMTFLVSCNFYIVLKFHSGNPFGKAFPDKFVKDKFKEFSGQWDADLEHTGLPDKFSLKCVEEYLWRNGNYSLKKVRLNFWVIHIWQCIHHSGQQCIHHVQCISP